MIWVLVALGAGAGAGVRWTVGRRLDGGWPTGTMLVNLLGSFLLGLFSGLALHTPAMDASALALLGTGFCGGLTTFSSWMVQSAARSPRAGTAYVVSTLVGSLALCWLGFVIGA